MLSSLFKNRSVKHAYLKHHPKLNFVTRNYVVFESVLFIQLSDVYLNEWELVIKIINVNLNSPVVFRNSHHECTI